MYLLVWPVLLISSAAFIEYEISINKQHRINLLLLEFFVIVPQITFLIYDETKMNITDYNVYIWWPQ
jgi:hypothetical protein